MLMKTGIVYFTTCFHGFGILRHVDPFVRMLHICSITNLISLPFSLVIPAAVTNAAQLVMATYGNEAASMCVMLFGFLPN